MKKGKIKFEDILGEKGKRYDNWINNQIEGYYLTYKSNFYKDEFDFAIERKDCGASEPLFLTNDIEDIIKQIDYNIKKQKNKNKYER